MTIIETITKMAGTIAEGYEPEALARAFWTLICEPTTSSQPSAPSKRSRRLWELRNLQTQKTSPP
jgi:hypothetical protein